MSERDDEWIPYSKALKEWKVPPAPSSLGDRLERAYAARVHAPSLWRRIWYAKIALPAPLAAALALLFAVTAVWALRSRAAASLPAPPPAAIRDGGTDLRAFQPPREIRMTIIKE